MSQQPYIKVDLIKLQIDPSVHVNILDDGRWKMNHNFSDKLIEMREAFRRKLILPIDETIGRFNWAIRLGEMNNINPEFLVQIYADNEEDQWSIISIIKETMPNTLFSHEYIGTVPQHIALLGETFGL